MGAVGAEDAAGDRRVGIPIGLDEGAALQAAGQLRPEAHGVKEMELEPSGHEVTRHAQ